MPAWTIYESYDPATGALFLDVVDESARPPVHGGLRRLELERFRDFRQAHRFLDGYIDALSCGRERFVRAVHCGSHRRPGCDAGPCPLGATPAYRCAHRDRRA